MVIRPRRLRAVAPAPPGQAEMVAHCRALVVAAEEAAVLEFRLLPLYVFCGERLLVAYLRPSKKLAWLYGSEITKDAAARSPQAALSLVCPAFE
jgi:hypothetical protein